MRDCQHDLRLFLHMLVKVSNHHHRGTDFFAKIFRVLLLFIEDIKKYTNSQIFQIFQSNKRILLFLIENKILTVDEYFVKQIINDKYLKKKYPQYFAREIKPFMNENWFPKINPSNRENKNEWVEEVNKELPDDFIELRRIGENDSFICELIRNDSVKEFIAHINRHNIPLDSIIKSSIYETNSFLIKKTDESNNNSNKKHGFSRFGNFNSTLNDKNDELTYIKYAAFFGSIQIFIYLYKNRVELTPSLWLYTIHSKNAELIHFLEENNIKPEVPVFRDDILCKVESYIECLKESIACNHCDIANYFIDNKLKEEESNSNDIINLSLKYYNFSFLQNKQINESSLCFLCYYDYYFFANVILTSNKVDINLKEIQNHFFK